MKLSISGTYSVGKTSTAMALSYHTGLPRTLARTIREIMPAAVPGKTLAQVTPAEYLQIAMRRHCGRAVAEASLGTDFVSDGSSLQEWIYGAARVRYGMAPGATSELAVIAREDLTDEMLFFDSVITQYGHAFRQHVQETFDGFVHLRNERPMTEDGHRPMNEAFREYCDQMLLGTLVELGMAHRTVSGSMPERLAQIVDLFSLPVAMPIDDAIALMQADYAAIDLRLEHERVGAAR